MGANGQLGRLLVQYIVEGGIHQAKVLLQNQAQVAFFKDKGIDSFIFNAKDSIEKFLIAIRNIDVLVITEHSVTDLNSDTLEDIDDTIKLLEALRYSKLKRIIHISSFETNKEEWVQSPLYFRPILIKYYYVDQWLRASSLNYTIIHPGNLTDKKGTGYVKIIESDIMSGEISKEDVAKIVLACIENPQTIRKEFKVITGKCSIDEAVKHVL